MKHILLTGFEPFDQEKINPSWEAVRALHGREFSSPATESKTSQTYSVHTLELPCVFERVMTDLRQALASQDYEIVLCIGQAGGRPEVTVERIAINLDDARIPDNAGQQPIDVAIVEQGPAAYFSTLPVKAIVHQLREQGLPANVSHTAGTYVCNHLFYGLMHEAQHHPHLRQAGFIHIPYLPEQASQHRGAPSMSLDHMIKALEITIQTCLSDTPTWKESMGTVC